MILFSRMIRLLPWIWLAVAIGAGMVGTVVIRRMVPVVAWDMALAGWMLAVINSLAVMFINNRAVGRSKGAFIGWGMIAHALRVLTLLGIFASIIFKEDVRRASFFVMVFTALFALLAVEVLGLFRIQSRCIK